MMLNKIGREIPNKVQGFGEIKPYNGPFAEVKMDDLNTPKEAFFRLGTTDIPENRIDVNGKLDIKANIAKEEKFYNEGLTYADLSIKKMALEVSKSVEVDYNEMLEDLSLLWQGAATKSDTIKFAIYKLSNPDKDKPDQGAVKKVLTKQLTLF